MNIVFIILLVCGIFCWDAHKFKKCKEKGFCERLRNNLVPSGYRFVRTVSSTNDHFHGVLEDPVTREQLIFIVEAFPFGIMRIKMTEEGFHRASDVKFRLSVDDDVLATKPSVFSNIVDTAESVILQTAMKTELVLPKSPAYFSPVFISKSVEIVHFNKAQNLQIESYFYEPGVNETKPSPGDRSGVSYDVSFPHATHVYGLGERAMGLDLEDTQTDQEPYRLFNLDIFEYELNNKIGLYGNIPFIMTLTDTGNSAGVLFLNPSDTFVDVTRSPETLSTHVVHDNGLLNLFLIPGPTPKEVLTKYSTLTGFPFLPQRFSLGYHQCRWNYKDEEDVENVNENFDKYDLPMDVIWLDIEHTDGKRYFTWDKDFFPTPENMINKVAEKGRKMVTISDPHIKKDDNYFVYKEAKANDYFVKNADGSGIYENDCWPGKSSWLDFYNPEVRDFYAGIFSYQKYKGSTKDLFNWIDMNEPSVFNGPEITMDLNCEHMGGVKHREIHNMYGFYHSIAAYQGHLQREVYQQRPFLLSRSFFSGSQRYVAVWTGDNEAKWDHLRMSIPMLLGLSVSGMPFTGADVGGFFGDPDEELLVRWYQMGAFYPFYRAHAHLETKRREPWLFSEDSVNRIRDAIKLRYQLFPYVYTAMYVSTQTAEPLLRPLFFENPEDAKTHTMQDEFFFGGALLGKPVGYEMKDIHNGKNYEVYLPKGRWYEYESGYQVSRHGAQTVKVNVDLDSIPLFIKGGNVVPLKMRLRRSSALMKYDPYTLKIALDKNGEAFGELYDDDGETFQYRKDKEYTLKKFYFLKGDTFISNSTWSKYDNGNVIERIVIYGLTKSPRKVELLMGEENVDPDKNLQNNMQNFKSEAVLDFQFDKTNNMLVIRKPGVAMKDTFKIKLT